MEKIIIDTKKIIFENEVDNKRQIFFKNIGNNSIILE
jgi:hypothetical protein